MRSINAEPQLQCSVFASVQQGVPTCDLKLVLNLSSAARNLKHALSVNPHTLEVSPHTLAVASPTFQCFFKPGH